jgi:hypothetical protein
MPSSTETVSLTKASQAAGHRSFEAFLQSYGLKISSDDDVEEGKAILRGMGFKLNQ